MSRLSLGEWSSIAEIVAAVTVVISLFFVALEVRSNTRAVHAATLQSVIGIARQQVLLMASDGDLNRIAMTGDNDLTQLTPEERLRYWWQDRSFWLGMQTIYREWQLGVLPNEEWDVYNKVICINIGVRGTRALWSQQRMLLMPTFVRLVEACDSFRAPPTSGVFQPGK
jgi:hypothetical protein